MTDHASHTDSLPDWQRTVCYATALRRADRTLSRLYDDALRPAGLTTPQFSLLALIDRAPDNVNLSDLSHAQAMDRTTLSRNLAPLVRHGYVAIGRGADRRVRTVRLTSPGADVLRLARPLWQRAQDHIARERGLARMTELVTELHALSTVED